MFASSFLLKKENISFDRGLLNLQLLYCTLHYYITLMLYETTKAGDHATTLIMQIA